MTTAHRPTFDPVSKRLATLLAGFLLTTYATPQARGKDDLKGPAYHQRLLPAHTQLKFRKPGQGGAPDASSHSRDLGAELEAAEAAHFAKVNGTPLPSEADASTKRPLALTGGSESNEDEEAAKRRKILEETRDVDADESSDDDSEGGGSDSDSSDDDDDDEEAELQRELERVRRERAEKREREEAEKRAAEEEERERDIALGNPLLNRAAAADFNIKRRWDDDVVFKNQARGTEDKGKKKEFVNVSYAPRSLRSLVVLDEHSFLLTFDAGSFAVGLS